MRIGERTLSVSNLDKVLFPKAGWTKAHLLDHAVRIAPVMLPHLEGRAVAFVRFPDGVDRPGFHQKEVPRSAPAWLATTEHWSRSGKGAHRSPVLDEPAALVWAANLAAIEIHPVLARETAPDNPTHAVFDLDPGPGTGILTCAGIALELRAALEGIGLASVVKTSGGKGLHVHVPLAPVHSFAVVRAFARTVSEVLARRAPERLTTTMAKPAREGRVFLDWQQNLRSKTTVAPYSLRARDPPTVATPLAWGELEQALSVGDEALLTFGPDEVVARLEEHGDLLAPLLASRQRLVFGRAPV